MHVYSECMFTHIVTHNELISLKKSSRQNIFIHWAHTFIYRAPYSRNDKDSNNNNSSMHWSVIDPGHTITNRLMSMSFFVSFLIFFSLLIFMNPINAVANWTCKGWVFMTSLCGGFDIKAFHFNHATIKMHEDGNEIIGFGYIPVKVQWQVIVGNKLWW